MLSLRYARSAKVLVKDKRKFRGGASLAVLGGVYRLVDLLLTLALLPSDLRQLWEDYIRGENLSIAACAFFIFGVGLMFWSLRAPQRRPDSGLESSPMSARSITTHGQTGGFNNTGDNLTVNFEDRSLKRRFRNLFQEVDPRILSKIDSGEISIVTRMMDYQFDSFRRLCAENGSADLIKSANQGPTVHGATIINGSLGPTQSGDQITVEISFHPSIAE